MEQKCVRFFLLLQETVQKLQKQKHTNKKKNNQEILK